MATRRFFESNLTAESDMRPHGLIEGVQVDSAGEVSAAPPEELVRFILRPVSLETRKVDGANMTYIDMVILPR